MVTRALDSDVAAAERALADTGRPLSEIVAEYPVRFGGLVSDALAAAAGFEREGVARDGAQTLLSVASGIKHQVSTREEFLAGMGTGVGLLLLALWARPMICETCDLWFHRSIENLGQLYDVSVVERSGCRCAR